MNCGFFSIFLFWSVFFFFGITIFAQEDGGIPTSPPPSEENLSLSSATEAGEISETLSPGEILEEVGTADVETTSGDMVIPEGALLGEEVRDNSSTGNEHSLPESEPVITIVDTGEEIVGPIIENSHTNEDSIPEGILPTQNVFVEIDILVTGLEDEIYAEIQANPLLADNTDEDPSVDLIDPSLIPEAPRAEPEPGEQIVFEDPTTEATGTEATQSTIALLESLLEAEEPTFRRYDKEVIVDPDALHTCRADVFRMNISDTSYARVKVTLLQNRKKPLPSVLEIGGLPAGIDVVFDKNNSYTYTPGARENIVEFEITRQPGAEEGDFVIPIIYTLQGDTASSVVCQINLFNA